MSNTYDENLLAEAPVASKQARQEGYNIDLLESERTSPPIPPRTPTSGVPPDGAGASFPPAPRESTTRLEEGLNDSGSAGGAKEYTPLGGDLESKGETKLPWHKTTKGIVILAILALVIVAAAVGGGVGGALSGKSSNHNVKSSSSTYSAPVAYSSGTGTPGIGSETGGSEPTTTPNHSASIGPASTTTQGATGSGAPLSSSTPSVAATPGLDEIWAQRR